MKKIAIGLIKGYGYLVSPFLGVNCRFSPSCSEYAREAIEKYGVIKGLYFSACRLTKCHPFCLGGIDPVP